MYGAGQPYIDPQTGQWGFPGASAQQPVQPSRPDPTDLIRVNGMQGAKAYKMADNSRVPLFDENDDIIIIKATDGAGFPSYRRARLDWIPDEPETEYLTVSEFQKKFDELKGLIISGQQSVYRSGKNAGSARGVE